jgi:hypothetical protein
MTARDKILRLSEDKSEKGKQLRNIADISVCVSSQPFGWKWNGGKLMAMIATTLGDYWKERYNEELKHLVTTSLDRRGSQYNRIYKFAGYTRGHGHEHIPEEEYQKMMQWMKDNNFEIPSAKFGAGANAKMRRISAYRKASGDKTIHLKHNKIRGIYVHDAISPDKRQDVIDAWFERWGKTRFEKKKNEQPPYINGLSSIDNQVSITDDYVEINIKVKEASLEKFFNHG